MFKQFAAKHHLILKKGHNVHIFSQLLVNYVLMVKLKVYKWLKGIKRPIVHYYALCWNEEKMLPFVFDYYGQFVDKFTIFDNYSTDSSDEIIRSHKNAEIVKFSMNNQINDHVYQEIKNNCWKKSRGKADYVVVCDMDEFIYHPQIVQFLNESMQNGCSFFHPQGYDMYSDDYPKFVSGTFLPKLVRRGVAENNYSKTILFCPHRIVEINYALGAHESKPLGVVSMPKDNERLKMLHYKNLGIDHVIERVRIYRNRLSQINLEEGSGSHYTWEEECIIHNFTQGNVRAQEVVD